MNEGNLGIGEELMVELVDMDKIHVPRETLERWRLMLRRAHPDLGIGRAAVILEIDKLLKT